MTDMVTLDTDHSDPNHPVHETSFILHSEFRVTVQYEVLSDNLSPDYAATLIEREADFLLPGLRSEFLRLSEPPPSSRDPFFVSYLQRELDAKLSATMSSVGIVHVCIAPIPEPKMPPISYVRVDFHATQPTAVPTVRLDFINLIQWEALLANHAGAAKVICEMAIDAELRKLETDHNCETPRAHQLRWMRDNLLNTEDGMRMIKVEPNADD